VPDLAKELRPQIDEISRAMVSALAKVRPFLQRQPELLRRRAASALGGVSAAVRDAALGFDHGR